MNMKQYGFIFDLDGVICDTARYHYLAWKEIAEGLGINLTLTDNERLKGVSRTRSLEIILKLGGIKLQEEQFHSCCDKKNAIYTAYISKLTEDNLLPGVADFLESAHTAGIPISLGSASKNARMILKQLKIESMFDGIQDGNTVQRQKPDPQVFTNAADALNVPYKNCVVFEDSKAGILAARGTGMMTVGIGCADQLNADICIPSLVGWTPQKILGALMDR